MKLFKVLYETEITILAEDESEAISNSIFCVGSELPRLLDWELVEDMGQIPNWRGAIPYSAKSHYNKERKPCEEFLKND
jgi:hypothetical protein